MNIDVGNVKGFEDYLPEAALKREKIKEIAKKYFKLYGFMPVETPLAEYDELLKPDTLPSEKEEDEIYERFIFQDKIGRKLALRTDFAIQLPKLLKKDPLIKLPLRTYQIAECFKDVSLRAGRTREFTQISADIIGEANQNSESEIISVFSKILTELGIDFEVNISSKKLILSVIESVQIDNKRQVVKELDKINKIGEDLVKMNLKKYADSNQILTLFKMLEKSIEFFTENAFDGAQEVSSLLNLLNKNGVPVRFNPLITKSSNHYTGNIFEFLVEKNAIAAGGRYDNSLGRFLGQKVPAVGVSFSLESLQGLCQTQLEKLEIDVDPKILVISIEKDVDSKKLVKLLRENDLSCIMSVDKPGASLDYASYYKVPYVIFLGKEEVEKQRLKFRIMKTGEEKYLTEKQLLSFFKKNKNQKNSEEKEE